MMNNLLISLRKADIVSGVVLLAFCAAAYYLTLSWLPPVMPGDPGAAFFPRISLIVIAIFSALLLFKSVTARGAAENDSVEDKLAGSTFLNLSGFAMTVLYGGITVIAMAVIAFEIPAFLFLFAMLGMRTKRWVWSLVTALATVAIMYVVFVLMLKVRLPLLFLPQYVSF